MTAEDGLGPAWRPPPTKSKEDVKRLLQADRSRNFARFSKQVGSDFEVACSKRLKPQLLDAWTEERKSTPSRTFAKSWSTIKYSATSEPFMEPHPGLCSKRYQEWLRTHEVARDKHIHDTYHALERVKRAEEQYKNHEFKRQLTRDMLSRHQSLQVPELGDNIKSSLQKARKTIAAGRNFGLMAGVDRLLQEEDADKANLEKAKSAPQLALRPPTPKGQVKHLRNWAGPDHPSRSLRESTPWREHDEERALKTFNGARTKSR